MFHPFCQVLERSEKKVAQPLGAVLASQPNRARIGDCYPNSRPTADGTKMGGGGVFGESEEVVFIIVSSLVSAQLKFL